MRKFAHSCVVYSGQGRNISLEMGSRNASSAPTSAAAPRVSPPLFPVTPAVSIPAARPPHGWLRSLRINVQSKIASRTWEMLAADAPGG